VTEAQHAALVKLLPNRGADPNLGCGENADAFFGTFGPEMM